MKSLKYSQSSTVLSAVPYHFIKITLDGPLLEKTPSSMPTSNAKNSAVTDRVIMYSNPFGSCEEESIKPCLEDEQNRINTQLFSDDD